MRKKTIDSIALSLATREKVVETKINHYSYLITIDSGWINYGEKIGEVFAQPRNITSSKEEARSGYTEQDYVYSHGGNIFREACNICDKIKATIPEQKAMSEIRKD